MSLFIHLFLNVFRLLFVNKILQRTSTVVTSIVEAFKQKLLRREVSHVIVLGFIIILIKLFMNYFTR